MEEVCGFSKKEDLRERVGLYPMGNFLIREKLATEDGAAQYALVGFTVGCWSVAKTADQWKYLTHFMLAARGPDNSPELFVPERFVDLIDWCKDMNLELYKKMYLMGKGEYKEMNGFYCPSAEY